MRKRCRVGYLRLVRIRWPRLAASLKRRWSTAARPHGYPLATAGGLIEASLGLSAGHRPHWLATAGGLIEARVQLRSDERSPAGSIRWPRLAASLKFSFAPAGLSTSNAGIRWPRLAASLKPRGTRRVIVLQHRVSAGPRGSRATMRIRWPRLAASLVRFYPADRPGRPCRVPLGLTGGGMWPSRSASGWYERS